MTELARPAPTAGGQSALQPLLDEGKALLARGKLGPAAEVLGRAAAQMPDDPRVLCEWGIALKLAGHVQEARGTLERAFDLARAVSPDLAQRAGFILALTYGDQEETDAAIRTFEAVHACAPDSPLGGTAMYYRLQYRIRFGR